LKENQWNLAKFTTSGGRYTFNSYQNTVSIFISGGSSIPYKYYNLNDDGQTLTVKWEYAKDTSFLTLLTDNELEWRSTSTPNDITNLIREKK
jgi:hypothetical protein